MVTHFWTFCFFCFSTRYLERIFNIFSCQGSFKNLLFYPPLFFCLFCSLLPPHIPPFLLHSKHNNFEDLNNQDRDRGQMEYITAVLMNEMGNAEQERQRLNCKKKRKKGGERHQFYLTFLPECVILDKLLRDIF